MASSNSNVSKPPSLTKNAIVNSVKTVMGLIFPLITFPYVSRVLGAANIGKVNYAASIVSYFALFAALGITSYGVREGAKIKHDEESLTRFVRQIFTINLISSAIAYAAFIITVFVVPSLHSYLILLFIQSLTIGFTTIGVDWLYTIFEDYVYLSARTIIVQFISLILMFLLVHKPSDYIIYAGISVFAASAANIWGFFHARSRYCRLRPIRQLDAKRHLGPIMTLFTNNVAISIYSNAGTTLVGAFLGDVQVGFYSVAMKIYAIARQVINSLTVVSLPRLSYLSANDRPAYIRMLNRLFNVILVSCIPTALLLYVLASPIVLIISGSKYMDAIPMLQIIAFALAFCLPNAFITNAILIPLRRERKVVVCTTVGAIVNILIDVAFIPRFGTYVACYSIIAAELCVTVLSCYYSYDQLKKLSLTATFIHTAVGCMVIYVCHLLFQHTVSIPNPIVDFIVRGLLYAVLYLVVLVLMRDKNVKFFFDKSVRFIRRG